MNKYFCIKCEFRLKESSFQLLFNMILPGHIRFPSALFMNRLGSFSPGAAGFLQRETVLYDSLAALNPFVVQGPSLLGHQRPVENDPKRSMKIAETSSCVRACLTPVHPVLSVSNEIDGYLIIFSARCPPFKIWGFGRPSNDNRPPSPPSGCW